MKNEQSIILFNHKSVRRQWDEVKEKWYFSVIDIIEILTNSTRPGKYWTDLKSKLQAEGSQLSAKIGQLKLISLDGKKYLTDVADIETLLRLIQSIPSPKAEPFKRWLAQVGKERIDEIQNPELAQIRMKSLYEQKGYPKDWIDKRLRGIAIRQSLTDEWRERGVKEGKDYAILTAEISKATFGMTPSVYKKFKDLPKKSKANLRDHMNDLELIFTMLGESVTTEISKNEMPNAMTKHKKVAKRGGNVAGKARKNTEVEIGRSVISNKNFLNNVKRYKKLGP